MSSAKAESAFMASLLEGLDASVFSEELSPPQPRRLAPRSSQKQSRKRLQSSQRSAIRYDGAVKLSQSQSPRKKKVKKAQDAPSQPFESIRKTSEREAELAAAAAIMLEEGDNWMHDLLSPSPKRQSAHHGRERPLEEEITSISMIKYDTSPPESSTASQRRHEKYTRCVVQEVHHDTYLPLRYHVAPAEKFTTKGVRPSTVTAAMERKQTVLYVSLLEKIDIISVHDGKKGKQRELERRKVILRDEWLNVAVAQGDIIHLVGQWKQGLDHKSSSLVPVDKDDPDADLWENMDDLPTPSMESRPTESILTMTLASSTQSIDQWQADLDATLTDNLLILHPDILLSATAVSTVIRCTRKAYLQSKVKVSGPAGEDAPSESLLMGKMLHEVLQSCLTGRRKATIVGIDENTRGKSIFSDALCSTFPSEWEGAAPTNFSAAFVEEQIQSQVHCSLEDVLMAGLDTETAITKLREAAAPFGIFACRYLLAGADGKPKEEAEAVDSRSSDTTLVHVTKVLDVEEDIWSPMYGLKGFIDVSVEAEVVERAKEDLKKSNRDTIRRMIMPLELKTGRSVDMIQHQAQTMLYTLMMSDRYDTQVQVGLLYYSKTSTLHMVKSVRNEVRGLILARNDLARYLMKKDEAAVKLLPPNIESERDCSRCYVADECMLYRRALEKIDGETATEAIYKAKAGHLTQRHADFFQHWEKLLSLEEDDLVRFRRQLWTMTAEARESTGRCFASMSMLQELPSSSSDGHLSSDTSRHFNGMNERKVYRFGKADRSLLPLTGTFAVGDPISVSIEPDKYSIAQGHLLSMSSRSITLTLDRDLQSLMKRLKGKTPSFRIDKEEFANGMARIRYNLAKIFYPEPHGDSRRRELIVDLQAPKFRPATESTSLDTRHINEDQRKAVLKVLSADDYALIVGMPGTGKTTTIVELILELIERGKTILLTSYTHSAVDTICRKLIKKDNISLLRLGSSDRVHSDIRPYMLQPSDTVEDLQAQLIRPNVVATTCLSINHALFSQRKFDFCIVDEASQITLPTCLGPLRYADRFVLVGDSLQLPPLVKNAKAKEGGLDISLFDLLQRAHPVAVAQLRVQYRMNEDIMKLSNILIYNGELRCGNDEVRNGLLELPRLEEIQDKLHLSANDSCEKGCWLDRILDSKSRAIFINTDNVPGRERRVGETLLENDTEAEMVMQISAALVSAGVPLHEIGIITPYRQQIRALVKSLGSASAGDKIEVLTADKSQGRDKDVIIISFVRSNERRTILEGEENEDVGIGQLLTDIKRINVSITRARKKLILIGSKSTLSRSDLLLRLWNLMEREKWTMSITANQLKRHQALLSTVRTSFHHISPTSKKRKVECHSVLKSRPILQDILNEVL